MHKIALFAIIFASLAPTISHALANQTNSKSFLQEICGTNGQKLVIEVVTTKGQQLQTILDVKPVESQATIAHHMNHCPFCHAGIGDVVMPNSNPAFVLYLEHQLVLLTDTYQAPYFQQVTYQAPLTRGPPQL